MIPARQSPNDPAMINIATGNDAITLTTHKKSLRADVTWLLPEPAIEYASAAFIEMNMKKMTPTASLAGDWGEAGFSRGPSGRCRP